MLELYALDALTTIRTPLAFRNKAPEEVPYGNVRIFSIKDLINWRPDELNRLPRVEVEYHKVADSVQLGDILMPGRGASYPARLFEGTDLPLFPAGQIHVIQIKNQAVASGYLIWYLNRTETQEKIKQMLTGSTIMALNKSQLSKLLIEVPSKATQDKIAQLSVLSTQRKALREQLSALEDEEVAAACGAALQREAQYD